jgi:hypothetical protein
VLLERRGAVVDLLLHRVAEDARVDLHLKPLEALGEVVQDRQHPEALVGDDERALEALLLQVIGDQVACAGTEVNGGGEGESRDGHEIRVG